MVHARTSKEATAVSDTTASLSPFEGTELRTYESAKGKRASYDLAASVDGPLVSAFAAPGAKPRPDAKRSRELVFASPFVFANPLAVASAPPTPDAALPSGPEAALTSQLGTHYFVKNAEDMVFAMKLTLDWTQLDADMTACARGD
jgi:hypothetical protein